MKLLNFRYFFLTFMALFFGVISGRYIFMSDIFIIVLISLVAIFLLIYSIIVKKMFNYILILVVFSVGIFGYFTSIKNYTDESLTGERVVVARATNDLLMISSYGYIVFDDVKLDGIKTNKNLYIRVNNYSHASSVKMGDYLTFEADIYINPPYELGQFNNYAYKSGAVLYTEINLTDAEFLENRTTLAENIRQQVRHFLRRNMTENNSAIAFAALFGDKSYIPKEIAESFSFSGTAHLLAVSGIHIVILVAVLCFIMKKIKLKRYLQLIILFVILTCYCYLCGFSPSVVRAVIMSLIIQISKVLGKRYDSLNSVGLAGILIILIAPLNALDVGFLLSFSSVIFIILFEKTFTKVLLKLKLPNKIASNISISLCASLGTLPLIFKYFGYISLFTVLINLIIIPIFTLAFILLLPAMLLSLIFPAAQFLLIIDFIFKFNTDLTGILKDIPNSIIYYSTAGVLFSLAFYALFALVNRFVFLKASVKLIVVNCILILTIILSLTLNTPQNFDKQTFYYVNASNSSGAAIICTENNKRVLIDNGFTNYSISYLEEFLDYQRIDRLDAVILLNSSQGDNFQFKMFFEKYKIKDVFYSPKSSVNNLCSELKIEATSTVFHSVNDYVTYEELTIKYFVPMVSTKAVMVESDGTNFLFMSNISPVELEFLEWVIYPEKADVIIGDLTSENFSFIHEDTYAIIKSKNSNLQNILSIPSLHSFTFNFKNDNISNIRRVC